MRNAVDKGSIAIYHSLGLGRIEFESGRPGPFVYPIGHSGQSGNSTLKLINAHPQINLEIISIKEVG